MVRWVRLPGQSIEESVKNLSRVMPQPGDNCKSK
jgi:hypothetical protein